MTLKRTSIWTAALIVLFQLLTLNARSLNSDEALYMLLGEEIRRILSGGLPELHPIADYNGPLDFWIMGSVYTITGWLFDGWGHPWMVRIVPLVAFWICALHLVKEIRRWSDETADWTLLVSALSPMIFIYTRAAFPHGLLLAASAWLLSETLFTARTGQIHWLRIGIVGGLSTHTHTTAFLGFGIILLPILDRLFNGLKGLKQPRALAAIAFYLLLATPIFMTFPPPISGGVGFGSVALEIRNFANTVTGRQPLQWLYQRDPAPDALLVAYLVLVVAVLMYLIRTLNRSDWDRLLIRIGVAQLIGTGLLLVMCYRGRSLRLLGHERYFLVMVPGWLLLQGEAFRRVASRYPASSIRGLAVAALLLAVLRLAIPTFQLWNEVDPAFAATQWLTRKCPRERCVAVADGFWAYWPIRYYSRDRLDVAVAGDNWKTQPRPEVRGREVASCWYIQSGFKPPLRYQDRFYVPAQSASDGMVCYSGTDAALYGSALQP